MQISLLDIYTLMKRGTSLNFAGLKYRKYPEIMMAPHIIERRTRQYGPSHLINW